MNVDANDMACSRVICGENPGLENGSIAIPLQTCMKFDASSASRAAVKVRAVNKTSGEEPGL